MLANEEGGETEPMNGEPDGRNIYHIEHKISQVIKSIDEMTRENDNIQCTLEKLATDSKAVRRFHELIFGAATDSELSHDQRTALEEFLTFMSDRNSNMRDQIASLTSDIRLSEVLISQYKDALSMSEIRSDINRMRIAMRIRNPAGDIHLLPRSSTACTKVAPRSQRVSTKTE